MIPNKPIILSGIQPTGRLHLGHLLGVIHKFKDFQDKYQCYFMIADLHSLTTYYDKFNDVSDYITMLVSNWLATGIDPEKSTLFLQSMVPEHSELYLLLANFTPVSWLLRNPTYKDKLNNIEKDIQNLGFLSYPVLQAADILLYKTNFVPIGEDQLPHLEITREIARRIECFLKENYQSKKPLFIEPKALLSSAPKVLGTDGRKMSKSYHNTIDLLDEEEEIKAKIKKMKTDEKRIRKTDKGTPENCSVFSLYSYFQQDKKSEIESDCKQAKIGCVDCKKIITQGVIDNTKVYREYYHNIKDNSNYIQDIIHHGSKKAREKAQQTLVSLKTTLGFYS